MRKFIFTALALALAGCGGGDKKAPQSSGIMSAAECQTADWRAIGYEDGTTGHRTDIIRQYRQACAPHGVAPDLDGYLAGHGEGLIVYCQPQSGFNLGRQGHQYNGGCPFAMEGAFMAALADGTGLSERQNKLNEIQQQLNYARQRNKEIEFQLVDQGATAINPLVNPLDKVSTGLAIKNLMEEKAALKASIPQLEHDYQAAQADYEAYRASLAGRYS